MYEIICLIGVIAFFALLAEACECFLRFMYRSKSYVNIGLTAILTVNSDDDDIEIRVREMFSLLSHTKGELIKKVYLVNNGAENEVIEICRRLCSDNDMLELCSKDELPEKIQ